MLDSTALNHCYKAKGHSWGLGSEALLVLPHTSPPALEKTFSGLHFATTQLLLRPSFPASSTASNKLLR